MKYNSDNDEMVSTIEVECEALARVVLGSFVNRRVKLVKTLKKNVLKRILNRIKNEIIK